MGSLSVLLMREGGFGADPVRRMLEAAPHRGAADEILQCGRVVLGISNPEDEAALWCVRDHVGWGQIFYRDEPRAFYAATEAKQVIAGSGATLEPDPEIVEAIFYGVYGPEMSSGLRGVGRVPRAIVLEAGDGSLRRRRYWEPDGL